MTELVKPLLLQIDGNADGANRALAEHTAQVKAAEQAQKDLAKILQDIQTPASRYEQAMGRLNQQFESGRVTLTQYHQGVDVYRAKLAEAERTTANFSNTFLALGGAIAAATGIASAAKSYADLAVQQDRLNRLMLASSGSAQQAGADYAFAADTANRLGLDLLTTANAFGKFQAAAKGSGLEGQQVRDIFSAVSKASATLGLSAEDTSGTLLAIGQMMSKGKVQAEELRGQLGEHLPGAFQIAARAMGMTTGELDKALEKGEVFAADFLPRFARELDSAFSASRFDGAAANIARLGNAWTELKQELVNSDWVAHVADGLELRLRLIGRAIQEAKRTAARDDFLPAGMFGGGLSEETQDKADMADLERFRSKIESGKQAPLVNIGIGDIKNDLAAAAKDQDKADKIVNASKVELLKTQKRYQEALSLEAKDKGLEGADAQAYVQTELATIRAKEANTAATKAASAAKREASAAQREENRARQDAVQGIQARIKSLHDQFALTRQEAEGEKQLELIRIGDNHAARLETEQGWLKNNLVLTEQEIQGEINLRQQLAQTLKDKGDLAKNTEELASLEGKLRAARQQTETQTQILSATEQARIDAQIKSLKEAASDATELGALARQLQNQGVGGQEIERQLALKQKLLELERQFPGNQKIQDQARATAEQQAQADKIHEAVKADADNYATAWQSAIKRIDDGIANLWQNILSGQKTGVDTLKSLEQGMAAEIAHAVITRPLEMQVLAALGAPGDTIRQLGGTGGSTSSGPTLAPLDAKVFGGITDAVKGAFGEVKSWFAGPAPTPPSTTQSLPSGGGAGDTSKNGNDASQALAGFGAGITVGNMAESFGLRGKNQTANTLAPAVGAAVGTAVGSLFGGPLIGGLLGGLAGPGLSMLFHTATPSAGAWWNYNNGVSDRVWERQHAKGDLGQIVEMGGALAPQFSQVQSALGINLGGFSYGLDMTGKPGHEQFTIAGSRNGSEFSRISINAKYAQDAVDEFLAAMLKSKTVYNQLTDAMEKGAVRLGKTYSEISGAIQQIRNLRTFEGEHSQITDTIRQINAQAIQFEGAIRRYARPQDRAGELANLRAATQQNVLDQLRQLAGESQPLAEQLKNLTASFPALEAEAKKAGVSLDQVTQAEQSAVDNLRTSLIQPALDSVTASAQAAMDTAAGYQATVQRMSADIATHQAALSATWNLAQQEAEITKIRDLVMQRYDTELQQLQAVNSAVLQMRDTAASFRLSSNSPLSPEQKYQSAQSLYQTYLAKYQGEQKTGTVDALTIQNLSTYGQAYAEQAQSMYGNTQTYLDIFNSIQHTFDTIAQTDVQGQIRDLQQKTVALLDTLQGKLDAVAKAVMDAAKANAQSTKATADANTAELAALLGVGGPIVRNLRNIDHTLASKPYK